MEHYARELKTLHQAWKETLAQATPGSDAEPDREQGAGAGTEGNWRIVCPPVRRGTAGKRLSLDEAMAFIRRPRRAAEGITKAADAV